MSVTYGEYLCLDHVLNAQKPRSSDEHDEMLFIVIHQTYELWFKQILHEYESLVIGMQEDNAFRVLSDLQRILVIMKSLVKQIDVLETMKPMSFLGFRKNLGTSSGFQSVQFRAIEFSLGHKKRQSIDQLNSTDEEKQKLEKLWMQPSLFDHLLLWIERSDPGSVPEDVLGRDVTQTYKGDERVEDLILELYKKNDFFSLIFEHLMDWDEGLQEWRYRHVKLVERTMGGVRGTGGSAGIEYLKKSLFRPSFPDLWNLRAKF
ncbi:MAG: tryptophan 2,3-dioxygenase [Oligoflexales bacterium]